jgi:hypothetical protein
MAYPDNPEVVSSYSFQIYAFALSLFVYKGLDLKLQSKDYEASILTPYVCTYKMLLDLPEKAVQGCIILESQLL